MEQKKENKNSPIARRKFLRVLGTAVAGGSILAVSGVLASRLKNEKEASYYWQIDPQKCTHCGRCETDCVLQVSAVKCFHANKVCGYCDLCGGYFRSNAKELNTAAENLMCPTGAIQRKFVEDPYFEYQYNNTIY